MTRTVDISFWIFHLKGQDFRFVNIYLPNMVRERCLLLQELYNVLTSIE